MFCKVIQSYALIFAVLAQTLARVFRPAAHGLSRVVLHPRDGVFYTSNCDCAFAVRFHSGTSVAGYDPEKYLKPYRDAGSDVNAMRRIDYAARKDAINAQKRAAYQLRQKNRGQKVFITDQAIQKVPLVAPNGADHQTALFIQETHRELLNLVLCQMLG